MTRIVLELFHVFKLLSFFLASTGVPVSDNNLPQPTYLPPIYLPDQEQSTTINLYVNILLRSAQWKSQKGTFNVCRVFLARLWHILWTTWRLHGNHFVTTVGLLWGQWGTAQDSHVDTWGLLGTIWGPQEVLLDTSLRSIGPFTTWWYLRLLKTTLVTLWDYLRTTRLTIRDHLEDLY